MARRIEDDPSIITPFPTVPVSSGEWVPQAITDKQRIATKLIAEEMDRQARRHGMTRKQFMRTAAATASAFMILNKVHGRDAWGDNAVLKVKKEHCDDLDAARELLNKDDFVVDVQTHHIDLMPPTLSPEQGLALANAFCSTLRFVNNTDLTCPEVTGRMNYIKEMFIDSQTSIGVISGLPEQLQFVSPPVTIPPGFPLTPSSMAATRDLVNELAGSTRCLTQAMIDPKTPPGSPTSTDSLEHQVRDLGAKAIKCYTYNGSWRLDDPEVAYPIWEKAKRLGIRLINVHKGLPLQAFGVNKAEDVRTLDFPQVVKDFPHLKFCAYHSAYFSAGDHPTGRDAGYHPDNEPANPGRWGNIEFLEQIASIPKKLRKNVYAEIGSTFAILFSQGPDQAAHLLGRLLNAVGPKNILWGTDSIWWGSPQYLIDAFKQLQIPADMRATYGYPELTDKIKAQILGLNAARLYGIKKKDRKFLCTIPEDRLAQVQKAEGFRATASLRTYGARTRREFLGLFGHKLKA
jgi:predicted TIM-barrel fold metal-dependent hydrolase